MTEQIKQVIEFHEKFLQTMETKPSLLPLAEARLRYALGKEELDEYLEAAINNDVVETLDSFADQLYILLGSIVKHGMQDMIIPAFNLVHENNMKKLGPDGKPIFREDGKIIKPAGFEKVELKTLFENE
jgi:predicted HAD superfamily Cof-like phosphohydrolase